MKTNPVFQFLVAGAAVVLPLLNGCTQQSASNTPAYPTTISAPSPVMVQPTIVNTAPPAPALAPVATPVAAPLIVIGSNAPAATGTNGVVSAEPVIPANLRVSQALGDVIHLAQSGVEETIILTYVTNSPAAFLLGAEEIVYLKDLGVSSGVITSMMQRDQNLKQQWGLAGPPAVAAPGAPATSQETVAAAPTYVNPPQPVTVVAPQPTYVANDALYDSLTPYGSWVEIDGYGRCWRPTISIRTSTWQPYCDGGRWVYTDSGWYWMSDYSWGSVAFHYGRWFSHPRWGWCWWPDRVWAPSWVSWRYDNDNCGWAPLPPNSIYTPGVGFTYFGRSVGASFDFHLGVGAFTFVPWGRICDPTPFRYRLPQPRSVAIYTGTTVVNNFDRGHNNHVENRGIPADRVREHARVEVRAVKIREESMRNGNPRADRLEGSGKTLVVHRPTPPPQAGVATAPTVKGAGRSVEVPRQGEPRRAERPAPIIVNGPAKQVTPPAPTPARIEPATLPERKSRNEDNVGARSRENRATVVRLPEQTSPTPTATPTPTPTPVTRPTPIFSKPLVLETPPQVSPRPAQTTPAPAPTVIGGGKNSSGGRDYSVWSSPPPRPTQSSTAVAPTQTAPVVRSRATSESGPQNQTAPNTAELNRARENSRQQEILAERSQRMERERTSRSRVEERSSAPVFSTPNAPASRASAPAVVITPTPAPAPRPTYTPTPTPPPSAPRTEAQPAPSRAESNRSESRSNSGAGSDSGRNPRNR